MSESDDSDNNRGASDFIIKYRAPIGIASGIAGTALILGTYALQGKTTINPEYGPEEIIAIISGYGILTGAFAYHATSLAYMFKNPVKDIFKIAAFILKSPHKIKTKHDAKKYREKTRSIEKIILPEIRLAYDAMFKIYDDNFEGAIDTFEDMILTTPQRKKNTLFANLGKIISELRKCEPIITKDPYKRRLTEALYLGLNCYNEEAIELWKEISEEHGQYEIETNILYGRALESMQKEEMATEQWRKVLHMIRDAAAKGRKIEHERIGESEVYRLKESEVLNNVFVIKRSPRWEILEDELTTTQQAYYDVNAHIKRKGLERKYKVSRALRIVKNELFALVSLYEKGQTLTEYVQQTKDTKKITDCARFLAIIHSIMTDSKTEKRDEGKHFQSRINSLEQTLKSSSENIPEWSDAIRIFRENYHEPARIVGSCPYVFDKDAHGRNWHIGLDGKITAIDFQRNPNVPAASELSKLIEMGNYFNQDTDGNSDRLEIISAYHSEIREIGKITLPHIEEFTFIKLNADILRAISYSAFSFPRSGDKEMRKTYVRNAIFSTMQIRSKYRDIIGAEGEKKYLMLQRGLEKIYILQSIKH